MNTLLLLLWKSPQTAEATITSLEPLVFQNKIALIQECKNGPQVGPNVIPMLGERGYQIIKEKDNIGIGRAMNRLVNAADTRLVTFIEEDWRVVGDAVLPGKFMKESELAVASGRADLVRLRSRNSHGWPYYGYGETSETHLLNSIHWLGRSEFDNRIWVEGEIAYTHARHANWTNNPFVSAREFLLKEVLPFCNGSGVALETDIQSDWEKRDHIIGQHMVGIFRHQRID